MEHMIQFSFVNYNIFIILILFSLFFTKNHTY